MNSLADGAAFRAGMTGDRAWLNYETGLSELGDYRMLLHQSDLVRIVDISASAPNPPPPGHATSHQVALPYHGLFRYKSGSRASLVDANKTLFVTAGWDFADDHPVPGLGHASLVLVPGEHVLDEICDGIPPHRHSAFNARTRPASIGLRLLTHRIRAASASPGSSLQRDELALQALRQALADTPRRQSGPPSPVVERAKAILHAHGFEPLSLEEVAREVGVSPVYLTQEFTRVEGLPLYRYQMRLRLDRSLLELPSCENITELALSLGFSSHSHFSCAFKSAFGITPSQFRSTSAPRQIALSPRAVAFPRHARWRPTPGAWPARIN